METAKAKKIVGNILITTTIISGIAGAANIKLAMREGQENTELINQKVDQFMEGLKLEFNLRYPKR